MLHLEIKTKLLEKESSVTCVHTSEFLRTFRRPDSVSHNIEYWNKWCYTLHEKLGLLRPKVSDCYRSRELEFFSWQVPKADNKCSILLQVLKKKHRQTSLTGKWWWHIFREDTPWKQAWEVPRIFSSDNSCQTPPAQSHFIKIVRGGYFFNAQILAYTMCQGNMANQRNKINIQKATLKKWRCIDYVKKFKITLRMMLNESNGNR